MRRASLFVKLVLVGVGTAFVSMAQFLALQPDEQATAWNYVGAIAAIVVLIGVLFLILTEDDATKELSLARKAVETARATESIWAEIVEFEKSSERATELYAAYERMRDVLERTAIGGFQSEEEVLEKLMTAAGWHLKIAMGFSKSDQWTLCIYRAEQRADGVELVCRAHDRAIHCPIDQARSWPVGVGVSGVAYANRSEIIVPDMQGDGIGSLYAVPGKIRNYDSDRYRSIVVVPVKVGTNQIPWGVVVGTSSVPHHFNLEEEDGIEPARGARTLAGMVALVVALASGVGNASRGGDRGPNEPVSTDS